MYKILFFTSIVIACITSCRSTKNIQTAIAKKDSASSVVVVDMGSIDSANFIRERYNNLQNQKINFKTFSAKVKVAISPSFIDFYF